MLVNVAVYDYCCHTTLLHWTILSSDEGLNLSEFYESVSSNASSFHSNILTVSCHFLQIVSPRVDAGEHTMYEVRVGHSIEQLFTVGDNQLNMGEVIQSFGKFLKFYVRAEATEVAMAPARNAFQVMLGAQRSIDTMKYPAVLTARNKKDELYNDLLLMFKSKNLSWKSEEVHNGSAIRVLQSLRDALWYVDGSHGTLNERSCRIPGTFHQFTGYNVPEKHKHRKRGAASLSREVLLSHSQALFTALQCSFWDRALWSHFFFSLINFIKLIIFMKR